MSRWLLTLGLGVLSASAWAQQPVTPADLVGTVTKASTIEDRVMRRDSREWQEKYQSDWLIEFVSKETIRPTFVATIYHPAVTNKLPPAGGGLVTLGRVRELSDRGGGQALWAFDAGVLNNTRTFTAGAVKYTFAITRNGAGFDCTVTVLWGREVSVPYISMRSAIDGVWVQLVSAKQSSSSCQIAATDAKRAAPAAVKGAEPTPKAHN